jgi:NTP pyrophosphatase (non-canonical NTP hydrolase)
MSRFDDIRAWAHDRNLIDGSTPDRQFLKLSEEVGELAAGLAKGNRLAVIDGIGDAIVVLTILASQVGMLIEDCIDAAWDEIKDRKGRMQDGVFIKDGD